MAECEILEGCVNLNPIKLSWIGFYLAEKTPSLNSINTFRLVWEYHGFGFSSGGRHSNRQLNLQVSIQIKFQSAEVLPKI